jgi:cobalamin biosynthesis protein CobD/CbiB
MNPLRPSDWERRAFTSGAVGAVFALVIVSIPASIRWLMTGKWEMDWRDWGWFIVVIFVWSYFDEAITSVHEHLSDIEKAIGEK